MPIIKDGQIQNLNYGTLKCVFQDVARYIRTGKVPGWARELERQGVSEKDVMTEVILQTSEATIQMHESFTRALGQPQGPSLFESIEPTEDLFG